MITWLDYTKFAIMVPTEMQIDVLTDSAENNPEGQRTKENIQSTNVHSGKSKSSIQNIQLKMHVSGVGAAILIHECLVRWWVGRGGIDFKYR